MTDIDLNAIHARADAATEGPWETNPSLGNLAQMLGRWSVDTLESVSDPQNISDEVNGKADAEFIAHAREDIPALLAEVARLTEERDSAKARTRGAVADYEEQIRRADDAVEALAERTEERDGLAAVNVQLVKIGTRELQHRFRGLCPDEINGFDTRDPGCPTCRLLDADPAATLAARDAEKKAEALEEAATVYGPGQLTFMGTATEYTRAWLRSRAMTTRAIAGHYDGDDAPTPQQGDQG